MRFVTLLFFMLNAHAQIKPADQQYISQENLLLNPGLEQGRVNWTISGTATSSLEQTASLVLSGLSSLKFVASSQTFEAAQFTTKSAAALSGMQAMASVRVKTNQSGVQVCSIENSVHVKCVNVESTNQAKEYIIPFVFNSTNNGIVIKATSGTGTTYIDDAYVGIMPANRMPEISQAQLVGSLVMTGCSGTGWLNTSTSYTTPINTGCTYSATGDVLAPVTQTYGFRINNAKAGTYFITSSGTSLRQDAAASSSGATARWSDGTNTIPAGTVFMGLLQQLNSTFPQPATFTYENAASSVSINMQLAAFVAGGSARIEPDGAVAKIVFHVYYYPPKSKIYSQQCTGSLDCENVFSAKVSSAGVVSSENLDWINGNCTNATPRVCTLNTGIGVTTGMNCSATGVGAGGGIVTIITSNSTTVSLQSDPFQYDVHLICQKQGVDFKEKNVITGTFANVVTAPNIAKPKTCYYAFGGASATLASPTVCAASPCVEVYDSCSAGSSTRPTLGFYQVDFSNSTWKGSTPIHCSCSAFNTTTTSPIECHPSFATSLNTWSTNANGGFQMQMASYNPAGTGTNSYIMMECTADAP